MQNHWMTTAGLKIRFLLVLTLVLVGWLGSAITVSAQGYDAVVIGALTCDDASSCWNEIGAQFSVTTEDGEFLGSCAVTGDRDASNAVEACIVEFPFEVTGTLIVTEDLDTITPGYAPEENPIFVDTNASPSTRPSHDAVFRNVPAGGSIGVTQTSNIAIVPTENGQSVTDACFVLTTFGNTGCDDNGVGKITFRDVPLGTYTVHQTADLGPGRSVADFGITVTGATDSDGWERFGANVVSTGSSIGSSNTGMTAQEYANGGPWKLGIQAKTQGADDPGHTLGAHFTVTSESGEYIGECALESIAQNPIWTSCIVDVPSDTVSLVWEDLDSIPAGYAPVENPIRFDPTTYIVVPHGIGASFVNVPVAGSTTSSTTNAAGTRDIALITRDPDDGHLVLDGCYILLEYGNAACDENGDGQITYKGVPVGVYLVHQTQRPSGYPTAPDFEIRVEGPYPDVPLGYVVRQAAQQVSLGSRNVSVVFVDSRTHTKVESTICVELVGGTEPACDDALVDGQIDFLDVPAGTYPIEFSGLPAGWQIATGDMSGPVVTIESSPGKPSIQFVYVEVDVPDAERASSGSGSGGGVAPSSSGTSQRTWTAAIWVRLCDAPPGSGVEIHCQGRAGIVVNFSLASGEFLGSCTTGDPYLTPWGPDTVSDCTADGMPFNADIVAVQDPSTIPAGYEPYSETSVVHIGNDPLPFQDGPPFSLVNVRTDSGSSSSETGTANVTVLFLTLGQNQPTRSGMCVELVGATDTICVDNDEGRVELVDLPAGTYEVCVSHLAPNWYWAGSLGPASVTVTPGSSQTIELYEFFGGLDGVIERRCGFDDRTGQSGGSGSTASTGATLLMTFRGCPEGFDPTIDDPYASCTIPLDAPDASQIIWGGDGQGGMNITGLDRQYNGAYIYNSGPLTMNVQLGRLAPVVRDAYQVIGADSVDGDVYFIDLTDGETREVFIFYYFFPQYAEWRFAARAEPGLQRMDLRDRPVRNLTNRPITTILKNR